MKAVPGIELSTGSLGHGLSVGVGMSIANMLDNNPGNIYVLLGDGECNEGSVWEAAMLASHNKLNNITAIIDCNKLQGFGNTKDIIIQENLAERWKSFGWDVLEVDGHSIFDLESCFNQPATMNPKVIIAHTVKGKGVSFMEDKLEWHYKSPNTQELEKSPERVEPCIMRTTFLDTLMQQARIDDRIYLITPDLGFSVLEKFRDEFPKRFLNAGIAEQNAVGVASGLALSGKNCLCLQYSAFRNNEML